MDRAHVWGRVVFRGADHDSGVRMARNGFRTAQYGKVRITQKRKFYKSLSGPDAITLHKIGYDENEVMWPCRIFCVHRVVGTCSIRNPLKVLQETSISKKNDNFDRRKIANSIPS
ncbi:hypothetical protein L596_009706 [Steinernema carpocapsae]|uniref:Uncharacterized protein n=1 Tax=Steinernema carpocapsae TaxID=34508 RepID=A0A4V6A6N1_STECR|nr:hypothetical protein L596_009706 [Steinernema carpocapsae]